MPKLKKKFSYRKININTLKGLKHAEWLKARGWVIRHSAIDIVYMEKDNSK